MGFLYVAEHGAKIGLNGGLIVVTYADAHQDTVPKETISGISIFGKSQLTTQLTQYCLEHGIRVSYFSQSGHFYGTLTPPDFVNVTRIKKQMELTKDSAFRLTFARKIVSSKIANQLTVVRRYIRDYNTDEEFYIKPLLVAKKKIDTCNEIAQLMGYEGNASREYFSILSQVIDDEFRFDGRNRMPAKDPFNAMLNFGYSLLAQEIHGELENHGICSYAGFMHEDKAGHAALASDMMEEWRPVIVDSVVLGLIRGHEISIHDFTFTEDGACLFTNDGMKTFIAKLETKMFSEMQYLSYIDKPVSFRKALWHQCERLARAIDMEDVNIYQPVRIR